MCAGLGLCPSSAHVCGVCVDAGDGSQACGEAAWYAGAAAGAGGDCANTMARGAFECEVVPRSVRWACVARWRVLCLPGLRALCAWEGRV
jgi:hypothetical protein